MFCILTKTEFEMISRIAVGAGDVGNSGVDVEGEAEEDLFEKEGRHFRARRARGEEGGCD